MKALLYLLCASAAAQPLTVDMVAIPNGFALLNGKSEVLITDQDGKVQSSFLGRFIRFPGFVLSVAGNDLLLVEPTSDYAPTTGYYNYRILRYSLAGELLQVTPIPYQVQALVPGAAATSNQIVLLGPQLREFPYPFPAQIAPRLCRFDPQTLLVLDRQTGVRALFDVATGRYQPLPALPAHALACDGAGRAWFSTNKGIVEHPSGRLLPAEFSIALTYRDGRLFTVTRQGKINETSLQ